MILKSKGWRYHEGGWEEIFKPISETCTKPDGESISNWPGNEVNIVIPLKFICLGGVSLCVSIRSLRA